jgi:hypothetical protein
MVVDELCRIAQLVLLMDSGRLAMVAGVWGM